MLRRTAFGMSALFLLVGTGSWAEPVRDHLQCFKVKDPAPKAEYTALLSPHVPVLPKLEPGCTIRVPAKQICFDVAKSEVDPAPPGSAPGIQGQAYLCYRAKCNKLAAGLDVIDQFGARTVTFSSTSTVCAPVSQAPQQTCLGIKEQSLAQFGIVPANGSYTLYVDGDPAKPWTAYCHDMNREEPTEYLSVAVANNYSQISDGTTVTETRYRRLRIDPLTLVVDLLDDTFGSTNEGNLPPPGGREHVPLGWAQFASPLNDDGPPAKASIDLTGTSFAMAESVLDGSYFCTATSPVPLDGWTIAADLSSATASAVDPVADSVTKVVADCSHLSVPAEDFTTGVLPLQYVAP